MSHCGPATPTGSSRPGCRTPALSRARTRRSSALGRGPPTYADSPAGLVPQAVQDPPSLGRRPYYDGFIRPDPPTRDTNYRTLTADAGTRPGEAEPRCGRHVRPGPAVRVQDADSVATGHLPVRRGPTRPASGPRPPWAVGSCCPTGVSPGTCRPHRHCSPRSRSGDRARGPVDGPRVAGPGQQHPRPGRRGHRCRPGARERVRTVASAIQAATGPDVDITVGSSPSAQTIALPAGKFGDPR